VTSANFVTTSSFASFLYKTEERVMKLELLTRRARQRLARVSAPNAADGPSA
jgi:hypothetical protein